MKRFISLILSAMLLVTLVLSAASCGMESTTGYTRLRDHIKTEVDDQQVVSLDAKLVGLGSATLSVTKDNDDNERINLVGYVVNASGSVYQLTLLMNGSSEKAEMVYEVINAATAETLAWGKGTILLTHYTGNDFVTFESVEKIPSGTEFTHRQNATILLNSLLLALDTYTTENLDMNLPELGFIALSDKYMADTEKAEAEEDLGGPFSAERLSMAGLMILQGVGMVFLVLAILWLVLLVFKKIFYKDPDQQNNKSAKQDKAPMESSSVATSDNDALVAAITAAVSAYIDSDPALSTQFAEGFRVVSFKKKSGKSSWNH